MSALLDHICELTGARAARRGARIQSLWSGYGEVFRVDLEGAAVPSVVVKQVRPPPSRSRAHRRKLRSYAVEQAWYQRWSPRCGARCRVAACLEASGGDGQWQFVLEDLTAAGFDQPFSAGDLDRGLSWLAHFHATFLGAVPDGLWPQGTYWHLATRPDELSAMPNARLRAAAPLLDARLRGCVHTTLVHGDAKPANFCVAAIDHVAAVDFQYVGGGCGIRDVAYLIGASPQHEARLAHYFGELRAALAAHQPAADADAIEAEWRALYPIAVADFARFLDGWLPGHRPSPPMQARIEEALSGL